MNEGTEGANHEGVIKTPLKMCSPANLDFDGDEVRS
jgi:hypothetical protein